MPPPLLFGPEPQEVGGRDQPLNLLAAAASRSAEDGAEAWGVAGARDGTIAGSQDRRFPRAGMKNSLYIKGD